MSDTPKNTDNALNEQVQSRMPIGGLLLAALVCGILVYFLGKIGLQGVSTGEKVTYLSALAGGMLSFLSPCVLPLVPPYLGFMAGSSISDLANPETAKR